MARLRRSGFYHDAFEVAYGIQVIGKLSNNPELHEKGALRELGGKGAARSEARAPHD